MRTIGKPDWVLRYAYHFTPEQIVTALRKLFGLPNVTLRDADLLALALAWHTTGLGFADALHLAQAAHCAQMLTFDHRFVSRAQQIQSCPVNLPI